ARRVPPPADAPAGTPDGPVRVRAWRVDAGAGGRRVLRAELAAPAAGAFQLTLALAPRGPLPAAAELPLPAPEGEPLPAGGYVAYRARGLAAQIAAFQRVTGIDPRDFAPFWPEPTRPDPDTLRPAAGGYAGQFVRGPREAGPPLLRLRLTPAPPRL